MSEKIDIKLSEHVAKEAAKKIINLEKLIEGNKDIHIALLQDSKQDWRTERKNNKRTSIFLFSLVFMLAFGSIITGMYGMKLIKDLSTENDIRMKDFLSQYEFQTEEIVTNEYTTEAKADNGSNIENSAIIFPPPEMFIKE